jgi:hypothetical protein
MQVMIHGRHIRRRSHRHHKVDLVQAIGQARDALDVFENRLAALARFQVDGERAVRTGTEEDLAVFEGHRQLAQSIVHWNARWS